MSKVGVPQGWKVRVGSRETTSGGEVAEVDHYYRLSDFGDPGGIWGRDVALMHLRTPVRTKPIHVASNTPAVGTPVRILGWGVTCDDMDDPVCVPTTLRQADTVVQPSSACPGAASGELCIGSRDGSVAATNMDSGGPALVREDSQWVLAGVVSGPSGDEKPVLYTDVTKHTDWINDIISGAHVPPDSTIPDVEGAATLSNCVGSVVRAPEARPQDPALLLTNGHCVQGKRPEPGTALVDQPADLSVPVADRHGYPQVTARATRLEYATMTGTDIALYRLNTTYAQLAAEGAKVFRLSTTPARAGDQFSLVNNSSRLQCTAEAVVPHLKESGYQADNSLRYTTNKACLALQGMSGSALVAPDESTIVGIHSTHNIKGEECTENNPCEVDENGDITAVKGRAYGEQVAMIPACLTSGSRIDLSQRGCVLTKVA